MRNVIYTIQSGTQLGFALTCQVDDETPTKVVDNVDPDGPSAIADLSRIATRHFDGLCKAAGWVDAGRLGPGKNSALMSMRVVMGVGA